MTYHQAHKLAMSSIRGAMRAGLPTVIAKQRLETIIPYLLPMSEPLPVDPFGEGLWQVGRERYRVAIEELR
jgi:hypothetical protein